MRKSELDIAALTAEERLGLLEPLWGSLASTPEAIPLTEAQREELDRPLDDLHAEGPVGIPWDEASAESATAVGEASRRPAGGGRRHRERLQMVRVAAARPGRRVPRGTPNDAGSIGRTSRSLPRSAPQSVTARIFKEQTLGVASDASFQEKVSRSLSACGVLQEVEKQLGELGWEASDASLFTKTLRGALNQGAYVMQALRSRMGDVHGTKPILKPLVCDSIKWAELIVRILR